MKTLDNSPTKAEYEYAERRIEALLSLVDESSPVDALEVIEHNLMSDVVYRYEEAQYPIAISCLGKHIETTSEE